jgi:hypothetical protein
MPGKSLTEPRAKGDDGREGKRRDVLDYGVSNVVFSCVPHSGNFLTFQGCFRFCAQRYVTPTTFRCCYSAIIMKACDYRLEPMADGAEGEAIPPPAYDFDSIPQTGTRSKGFMRTWLFRAVIAGMIL